MQNLPFTIWTNTGYHFGACKYTLHNRYIVQIMKYATIFHMSRKARRDLKPSEYCSTSLCEVNGLVSLYSIVVIRHISAWHSFIRWVTIVIIQQRDAQIKTIGYEKISFAFDSKHVILRHVIHLLGPWFQNYFTELKTHFVDEFGDNVCMPARPITAIWYDYACQVNSGIEITTFGLKIKMQFRL